jgi:hypothetical protein
LTYDALPPACFHVFDGGIEVGLQLTQMAQVPHHAIRSDRVPVGPLDLDNDKHLLITIHLDGQIDAPPATPRISRHCRSLNPEAPASPARKADWTVLWKATEANIAAFGFAGASAGDPDPARQLIADWFAQRLGTLPMPSV